MDRKTVLTKTAKGLMEVTGKTSLLPRDLRNVLAHVDGKATIGDLHQKLERFSETKLMDAVGRLLRDGFVREFVSAPTSISPPSQVPIVHEDAELDFDELISPPQAKSAPSKAEVTARNRAEADEVSRQVAEARARQEAEAKAKQEAEEKARRDAQERARKEAEEKAKREAEEKARLEAQAKAKREAEEKARREAEEKARLEAQAKAKREAEEKAKREAEQKARRELEERARKEAEEKAKREAAEKAKREAEERTRREAEAKAKREAEAKAKREAEEKAKAEKARREAEEKARHEAEAKAKREAEARAKREAEEKAERDAEDKARREAEEKARREAEERGRREAEEHARLESEARARREAELRAQHEHEEGIRREIEDRVRRTEERARREAEERAKRDAAEREARERAQREAEEARVRREAEEHARLQAEELARRVAEAQALRATAEARQEAADAAAAEAAEEEEDEAVLRAAEKRVRDEEKARAKADAEAAARARREERVREQAAADARETKQRKVQEKEAAAIAARLEKIRSGKKSSVGKYIVIALALLLAGGLTYLHFLPLDIPRYEQLAASRLGVPVKIGSGNLSFFPSPSVTFENVRIGQDANVRIATAIATPDYASLLSDEPHLKSIELKGVTLNAPSFAGLLFGRASGSAFGLERVHATGVKLAVPGVNLPELEATATFGPDGAVRNIVLSSAAKTLDGEIQPRANGQAAVELTLRDPSTLFGLPFVVDSLSTKGIATASEYNAAQLDVRLFDGVARGKGQMRWSGPLAVDASFEVRQLDAKRIAPALNGRVDGRVVLAAQADMLDKLSADAQLGGNFSVQKGQISGIDLPRSLQTGRPAPGSTNFNELSAQAQFEKNKLVLRTVKLEAGSLSANGAIEVEGGKSLAGNLAAEMKIPGGTLRTSFVVSGTPGQLTIKR